MPSEMVGMKRAARFTSRMSNERSADELHPRVPKFIVTPRLVDETLTGMACRHDLGSAFAPRNHVMSTRWDLPFAKHAGLGHKIFREKHI